VGALGYEGKFCGRVGLGLIMFEEKTKRICNAELGKFFGGSRHRS